MFARWLLPTLLLVAAAQPMPMMADDAWPCFRGPTHDGVWRAPPLAETFPKEGLNARWRTNIGAGYAGVVVADGLVYTMDRPNKSAKGKNPDGAERVLCLNADTGAILWKHEYPAHYGDLDYGTGPRAAPTVHAGRVFTLGAVGAMRCLNARTGAVVWEKQAPIMTADRIKSWWGFAASPVIFGDRVIYHIGLAPNGCVVAYEQATGKEIWRALPDPAGYCTPLLIERPTGPELVLWTPENVHGVDARDGAVNWSMPYPITYGVSIAGPLHHDGLVLVSGYWEEGSKAIRLGPGKRDAKLAWENRRTLRGLMAAPLHRDGYVYQLDKQFGLTCIKLADGEKVWDDEFRMTPRDSRNPHATMVWINDGDRVAVLNASGELILARFNPDGYQEQARAKIIGKTWAYPAFAKGAIFARSDEEITRVDLPRK